MNEKFQWAFEWIQVTDGILPWGRSLSSTLSPHLKTHQAQHELRIIMSEETHRTNRNMWRKSKFHECNRIYQCGWDLLDSSSLPPAPLMMYPLHFNNLSFSAPLWTNSSHLARLLFVLGTAAFLNTTELLDMLDVPVRAAQLLLCRWWQTLSQLHIHSGISYKK